MRIVLTLECFFDIFNMKLRSRGVCYEKIF